MLYFRVKISGVSPLMLNKYSDEEQARSQGKIRKTHDGERDTAREAALKKLHLDADGKIIIPQQMIFNTIMAGGSYFKYGKQKVTTLKTSLIAACLEVWPFEIPLIHSGMEVDSRPVSPPQLQGVAVIVHRPRFDEWGLDFELALDDEILSEKLLREIVDAAGKRIGMGCFRPGRKGPYGKFRVDSWDQVDKLTYNRAPKAKKLAKA